MKNKINISLICLTIIFVLCCGEVEAACLPMPNLLGKIQPTGAETKISYEYACNECAKCAVNEKPGCWDGKIGKCLFDAESRTSIDYRSIAIINKQVCGPLDERLLQSLKNKQYIVFPSEIIADGDIFFSVGGCGTPNPSEIFLHNKNGDLKYAHIKQIDWQTTPKNIDGMTIWPQKKNKIICADSICTYSGELEINGEKMVLEPNQVFQGENFTLKYLGSSLVEDTRREDFLDYFDYEIYFNKTWPESGAESAGASENGLNQTQIEDGIESTGVSGPGSNKNQPKEGVEPTGVARSELNKVKYWPLALFIACILIFGGLAFFLKFKSRQKP